MYRDKIEHKYLVKHNNGKQELCITDLLYFIAFCKPQEHTISDYFHLSQWESTLSWCSVSYRCDSTLLMKWLCLHTTRGWCAIFNDIHADETYRYIDHV